MPLSSSKCELAGVTKSTPATLVVQGGNLLIAKNTKTPDKGDHQQDAATTCPVHSTMFQPKDRVSNLSKEASKRIKTDQEHFGSFRITMPREDKKRGN